MIDFMNGYLVSHQLHLGTFATINQVVVVMNGEALRSWKPSKGGYGSA